MLLNWALLLALVLLWGTSFMFTAIAVDRVDPVSVVFFRLLLGSLVISVTLWLRGERLPRAAATWAGLTATAIVGNAAPFFLIAWGQQTVDSGVAGMIMAIMPLLTMVFAHYLVPGETLNRYKLLGFALGLTGVTLLLGPVFEGGGQAVISGLAIFLAACCYAGNAILIKRLPGATPLAGACGMLIMGTLVLLPFWLTAAAPLAAVGAGSLASVIWLGIGPTGIASIILFVVIARAGPTFLSTINYLIPAVAFLCGAWLLSEPVTWAHFAALATILVGIGVTRIRPAPVR